MIDPIPAVYILSSGRSGSTLTDLLLGSHPEIWTLGEAQLLPYELEGQGDPCGCGSSITECDFWNAVLPNIPLEQGRDTIGYFRESHGRRKTFRLREAASLLTGVISARQARDARNYGSLNAQYFSAVLREARSRGKSVKWLVDASKGPYRLYWLLYSGKFNLRVIHLTKDPRAYVYSMIRRRDSYSIGDVIRFAARWTVDNLIQSMLAKAHFEKDRTLQLRYDEVASCPGQILSRCASWLGLNGNAKKERDVIRKYTNHAVSGNEMRWEDTEVRLDERWKHNFREKHRRIVWKIAGGVARMYGYNSKITSAANT